MVRVLQIAVITLVASCGDNRAAPPQADSPPLPPLDADVCAPVIGEPDLALDLVAGGFDKPVYAGAPAGDSRIFVIEHHTGLAKIIENGVVRSIPFLDLGNEISRSTEAGLLTLAFHPRFTDNATFYVTYTRPPNELVLEEWKVDPGDPNRGDPTTRREILAISQSTAIHAGGRVAFGPDGYLYLGHGDGGPQHDPEGNAQDLGKLLGKFLRIDVDRRDPGLEYAIPSDNPFVDVPGVRGEIWAYGVRNPWGFAIDPATGHLFFGDVGLARWEEIDVIPSSAPGGNYGWPIVMGPECEIPGCDKTGLTPPLVAIAYGGSNLCATVGGAVYRGCRMPGHHGRFFYSDFCASFIHSIRWSELSPMSVVRVEHPSISNIVPFISAIGIDGHGELLIVDWDAGQIHRVVPAP
jgi:glucose/arabinose dehydrogenase